MVEAEGLADTHSADLLDIELLLYLFLFCCFSIYHSFGKFFMLWDFSERQHFWYSTFDHSEISDLSLLLGRLRSLTTQTA